MRKPVYTERVELCLSKKMKRELQLEAKSPRGERGTITSNELIRRIIEGWMNGHCY